jgi:hypothetical protein
MATTIDLTDASLVSINKNKATYEDFEIEILPEGTFDFSTKDDVRVLRAKAADIIGIVRVKVTFKGSVLAATLTYFYDTIHAMTWFNVEEVGGGSTPVSIDELGICEVSMRADPKVERIKTFYTEPTTLPHVICLRKLKFQI